METKTENPNPVSLKSLSWHQLSPETIFWVICDRPTVGDMGSEVWQFEVGGLLEEVAEVNVTFPDGTEGVLFFEEVSVGKEWKAFFDSEKNGSFVGLDVVDILLWN